MGRYESMTPQDMHWYNAAFTHSIEIDGDHQGLDCFGEMEQANIVTAEFPGSTVSERLEELGSLNQLLQEQELGE